MPPAGLVFGGSSVFPRDYLGLAAGWYEGEEGGEVGEPEAHEGRLQEGVEASTAVAAQR